MSHNQNNDIMKPTDYIEWDNLKKIKTVWNYSVYYLKIHMLQTNKCKMPISLL